MFAEQRVDQSLVSNITLHEGIAWITRQVSQIFTISGIGQLVEVKHRLIIDAQPVENKIGSNEACTTGHENQDASFRE